MTFKFSCPHCGQHISTEPSQAGTGGVCPTCAQPIIVPDDNPPKALPRASTPASGSWKSTIFWSTLGAILAAVAILLAVRFFFFTPIFKDDEPPERPELKNAAVDVIEGYYSLKIGMPIQQIRSRIQPTPNHFGSHYWYGSLQQTEDCGYFEVANMLPEEKEWGGIKVEDITLWFRYGVLISIKLSIAGKDAEMLMNGFARKYGEPTTDDEDTKVWEGEDTRVSFSILSSSCWITLDRRSVGERRMRLDMKEMRQEIDRTRADEERRAEEVMKKL